MTSLQQGLGNGSSAVVTAVPTHIIPGRWTVVAPNPGLQPDFSFETDDASDDITAICARGNGSAHCFGYACSPVRLEAGKAYRLQVRFTARNLERPEHQVVHGVYAPGFTAGVQNLRFDAGLYSGEEIFLAPGESLDAELRLYFLKMYLPSLKYSLEAGSRRPSATVPAAKSTGARCFWRNVRRRGPAWSP
ncbi:MAG: hypothetical protein ABI806_21015 [Candidatus Solibacter sp.]